MKVALDPLNPAEVSAMLPDGVSDAAASRLVDATGGNAFLVTELARQPDRYLLIDPFPVPPSVQSIVDARLAGLPPQLAEVVEAASVLGRRGSVAVLAAVVGRSSRPTLPPPPPRPAPAGCSTRPATGRSSFRHALVRQAVAALLTPLERWLPCTWRPPEHSSAATASTTTGSSRTT